MLHKVNNKKKYDVSLQKVSLLKEKIHDPEYMQKAIMWIASRLATKLSENKQ